ncbi:MAG TPA: hypothetical protein VF590_06605 [Isosphaeraceae bacterium]
MPRLRLLFRAGSVGLAALAAAGPAAAQCPQVGGADASGTGGASAGAGRIGVVATPDPLCPQDVPCYSTRDAVIYLRLPPIQSHAGRSPHSEFSADGLNTFVTLFHSAAAKGVENATIRAFNAARACPDGKNCDQTQAPGAPAGGQVPLGEAMTGQPQPTELTPVNAPAGQPSGVQAMGEIQPPGAAQAGGAQTSGPAATSPPLQVEPPPPRIQTVPRTLNEQPAQPPPSQPGATPPPGGGPPAGAAGTTPAERIEPITGVSPPQERPAQLAPSAPPTPAPAPAGEARPPAPATPAPAPAATPAPAPATPAPPAPPAPTPASAPSGGQDR